jgi:uncharacterized protein (DUF1684 family)
VVDQSYIAEIETWRQKRLERLTSATGWLSLAGLFWLRDGSNSFGSGEQNDIVFPSSAPDVVGIFELDDGKVKVRIDPDADVLYQGEPVREMVLASDLNGSPTTLTLGPLTWYVIDREGRLGVRLKDAENPNLRTFTGIESFRIQPEWKLPAQFVPYDPPRKLAITDITGSVREVICKGSLVFEYEGDQYKLDPLGDGTEPFFVIFADATNNRQTYGAGRYVYVDVPDSSGRTVIDFNKAYNPPCAFTEFATCPLPPAQNKLDLGVTAGEKYDGLH